MSQTLSAISLGHIDEISSSKNEPDWLKEYRRNSLTVYESLPIETSPLYNKYTDAKKMDPQQVSLSISTTDAIPSFLQKRLGELENETCIIQIGTNIHKINLSDELKSKGLVISSIEDAIKNNPDLVKKSLEASNSKNDKFTALNNAAFNSGVFIHIPKNLILEKPIHILTCLSDDGISKFLETLFLQMRVAKEQLFKNYTLLNQKNNKHILNYLTQMLLQMLNLI